MYTTAIEENGTVYLGPYIQGWKTDMVNVSRLSSGNILITPYEEPIEFDLEIKSLPPSRIYVKKIRRTKHAKTRT